MEYSHNLVYEILDIVSGVYLKLPCFICRIYDLTIRLYFKEIKSLKSFYFGLGLTVLSGIIFCS